MSWPPARLLATGLTVLALIGACGSDDIVGSTKQTGKVVSDTIFANAETQVREYA